MSAKSRGLEEKFSDQAIEFWKAVSKTSEVFSNGKFQASFTTCAVLKCKLG